MVRAITLIIGTVVALTFIFGFGNVLSLALRVGVPLWVAPLIAPAVDLSVLGLLLAARHLALAGAEPDQVRPARRLLVFASVVTLGLNVADHAFNGQVGKAAFDAVGPLLLIGWVEVGPGLLHAINTGTHTTADCASNKSGVVQPEEGNLVERARKVDAEHWAAHNRPISAESLRRRLHIGTHRARALVATIRSSYDVATDSHTDSQ
ncbi:hypothetical protein [Saccharothrix variisporea]|uniref:DUF2637 domain-containing protein n=1 Tax=Saccharothrix variisporea TaxID=543527 RepID=A0A495X7K5_9PSEU|nr:hypothetical protein [Saccharothrix variisporea]RKT69539.1 hypothetical protein DFJ66_2772 [Saccharothrix variisporea]